MHKWLIYPILFLTFSVNAQTGTWKKIYELPIDSGAVWSVDQSQQLYLYQNKSLSKWNKSGSKLLEQSIKQIGDIQSIDANNLLKIAVFSENQQQLCFLDNALALENDCISLGDYEQEWATVCCASNQTDRFWVFDQINSELSLLSTQSQQRQIVQNVKDITGLSTVVRMIEESNFLYLIDVTNKVAQFDIYGTLINTYQFNENGILCISETGIFSIEDGKIYAEYDSKIGVVIEHEVIADLPAEITTEPVALMVAGNRCFVATKHKLFCFEIDS